MKPNELAALTVAFDFSDVVVDCGDIVSAFKPSSPGIS